MLWERMYLRWQSNWTEWDEVTRMLSEWKIYERQLQSKLYRYVLVGV